ncbi:MAG: hypothetical protein R2820_05430 [Cyclobacteriaceae bacterium]|nr:hypothetical protein [Cyclobacteriaceae bacterium]
MTRLFPLLLILATSICQAQDSLLTRFIKTNKHSFNPKGETFEGRGWMVIDSAVQASNQVLIGEDHFFNEIPHFISAIATSTTFQNFIVEIDPFTASLLQEKISKLSTSDFNSFNKQWQESFSFYALKPEMELMKQMVKKGAKLGGTDQIILMSDGLIANTLKQKSKNKEAIKRYEQIESQSARHLKEFLKDQTKPFYLLTPAFDSTLNKLLTLPLSPNEQQQLQDLQLSKRIYAEGSHWLRLQLMKNNFYKYYYPIVTKEKTLYKFGAVHMTKGEGLLGGYDIGNIVYNIADSRYEKSLHIMIVGKNGTQGSPFKGFPAQQLDPINGELKSLKPFFDEVNKEWVCFDLTKMHRPLRLGELKTDDLFLRRILQGYDYLVVIPEVTAATMD